MNINIELSRLNINVQGISAQMVEAAVQGLEVELRRRLGTQHTGFGRSADIGELSLTPLKLDSTLDVAGLRGLIAERLLDALQHNGGDA